MAELLCSANAIIELSDDGGTTWLPLREFAGRVDPGTRERPLQTYTTFAGPISCIGPAGPVDIELEFAYSEGDDEPYAILRDAHYAGTAVGLRWQVATGAAAKQWTAAAATVPTFDEPEINAESDNGVITLVTLSTDEITWLTVTP